MIGFVIPDTGATLIRRNNLSRQKMASGECGFAASGDSAKSEQSVFWQLNAVQEFLLIRKKMPRMIADTKLFIGNQSRLKVYKERSKLTSKKKHRE